MGLIYSTKLPMFRLGYPTVSDKYNVSGGVLATTEKAGVPYGTILMNTSAAGEYAPFDGKDVATIAGPMVAVNVKLADPFTDLVKVMPGEACSLMLDGYIALKLADGTDTTKITEGTPVTFVGSDATGKVGLGGTVIPGWYFTGLTENGMAEVEIVRHGA